MKLNRTGSNWTELERNKINENWRIIEGNYNDVVDKVSEEAFDKVVNSAKLNWKEPVDKYADLPSEASEGDTRMVRDSGKVYRFNGEVWQEIQQIDAGPVNELDDRLTTQLAEIDDFQSSYLSARGKSITDDDRLIVLTDDDGNRGFYTKLFKLAKEYNIPIVSAMITGRPMGFPGDTRPYDDRYYHYDEVMEMKESGLVEFIGHTHNHINLAESSKEEIEDDLKKSKAFLKKWGLNHRAMVYPFANYSQENVKMVAKYFDYAIGRSSNYDPETFHRNFNNFDIRKTTIEQGWQLVKDQMDAYYDANELLILRGHVDQGGWYSEQFMRDIIEYALNKGFKFVTSEEAFKLRGNILQFGDNKVTYNGNVFGNELGRYVVDNSTTIDANTSLDYFKPMTTTASIIRSTQSGFPSTHTEAGILLTHKIAQTEELYSYQEFYPLRNEPLTVYKRQWDRDNNKWTEWINTSFMHYLGTNAVSIDDKPSDGHLVRKVTYTKIDSNANSVFPLKRSGMLITNALVIDNFAYQEYHINNTAIVFKRYWNPAEDKWGDWIGNGGYVGNASINVNDIVPSKSGIRKTLSLGSINLNQVVTAQPDDVVPYGIVWNVFVSRDGVITLQITNITDSPITLNHRFTIQRLQY